MFSRGSSLIISLYYLVNVHCSCQGIDDKSIQIKFRFPNLFLTSSFGLKIWDTQVFPSLWCC